jgi:hypothetical protein
MKRLFHGKKLKLVKFITGPAVHRVVEFFKYLSKQRRWQKAKNVIRRRGKTKAVKPLLISASYN